MKNIFLLLCLIIGQQSIGFTQTLKVTFEINRVEIKPNENAVVSTEHRILKANVVEGSGDYIYAWGSTNPYVLMGDKTSSQVQAALNEEDITYRVFVKDNKTGKVGYNTINFKKLAEGKNSINVIAYPNPSTDNLTISLDGGAINMIPIRVELFSENSTFPVKSVPKEQLAANKYEMSTAGLAKGTYFIHVQYANEKTPKQVRVLINH